MKEEKLTPRDLAVKLPPVKIEDLNKFGTFQQTSFQSGNVFSSDWDSYSD